MLFFFQAEDGIRDFHVTGVQTCALPISSQKLAPTRGYIETRDGTLLSYRVVLPDAAVHGPGPYGLVITYSGYQPALEKIGRASCRERVSMTEGDASLKEKL